MPPRGGERSAGNVGRVAEGQETAQAAPPSPSRRKLAPAASGATRVARGAVRVVRGSGRAAVGAGRSTSAWARRPTGRLIVPATLATILLAGAVATGAYLVPQALRGKPVAAPTATVPPAGAAPNLTLPGGPSQPAGAGFPTASGAPSMPAPSAGRPAEALAGWAQQVGTRVGIPVIAVEAYGYAELVTNRTAPACHLSWTTLAALGQVESRHGSAGGSVLGADGVVRPPIYGLPLDGNGGRRLIRDTDQGAIDNDSTYDRAVGPLQFIPSTWRENAIDANSDGVPDPNDIDDASLTAASYLCKGGRDLAQPEAWWAAILSYNEVRPYAQRVFEAADQYGRLSRG